MKKAYNILYLIGFILCIVSAVALLVPSPILFVLGVSPKINDILVQFINDYGTNEHLVENKEIVADLIQFGFVFSAIMFIVLGLLCVVNAFVVRRATKEETRALYIATIVLGVFTSMAASAGGILGLIYLSKKPKQETKEEIAE